MSSGVAPLILTLLLGGCLAIGCSPSRDARATNEKTAISQALQSWRRQQIQAGALWPADSCKPWLRAGRNTSTVALGFPADSAAYRLSLADLNQDGNLDGLLLFTPEQCDGGNGSMWTQREVLVLSTPRGYAVNDSLQVDRFAATTFDAKGFYQLDSLGPNRLYATYCEFNEDAGHCCPSLRRPVVFDFAARRLVR